MKSNSDSFKIDNSYQNFNSMNTKENNNYIEQEYNELINSNDNDIYEKKNSIRSAEELKYEKNKNFPISRDYIDNINFMRTYNQQSEKNAYKKNKKYEDFNIESEKLNINDLNEYIESENKKYEKELKELKDSNNNSYKKKDKKNNIDNNFNITIRKKNNFTFGKPESDYKNLSTNFLSENSQNKTSKTSTNKYLIIQPRNSPVFIELEFSKNTLKNMKGKNKKNNHSSPKINKNQLFKNTINDIFNGNKDPTFLINNIQKILGAEIKNKEIKKDKNYQNLKTKSHYFFNNSYNYLTLNNPFSENSYLRTESNNLLKKNYSKNFDFSNYIKKHSLDAIAPKNNFNKNQMFYKIINNQKISF